MAYSFGDPDNQALMAFAAAMMQAGGASDRPVGLGQALGRGMQGSLGQYALATKSKQEGELANMHAALYKAQVEKAQGEAQRQQLRTSLLSGNAAAGGTAPSGGPWSPSYQSANPQQGPWVAMEAKGQKMIDADFIEDGKKLIETAKILKDRLEMKDGVWYDKFSGQPVVGGHSVNQQGFGSQFNVGPGGQVSMGALPGSDARYLSQGRLGAQATAERDLVTVPAAGPNQAPRFASRESLLNAPQPLAATPAAPSAPVPAGPTPAVAASMAADAAQASEISKNHGKIYNDLQNDAMRNPAQISKFRQIGKLLDGIEGGKFSEAGKDLASAANSLNIKIDSKLPAKEAAAAISNEIALSLRSTASGEGMPGAMSDADREFLKSMTPQLAQTNEGRKQIIDARVKVMERNNEIAKMARKYRAKYNKLDEGFFGQLQDWSNSNPIFK